MTIDELYDMLGKERDLSFEMSRKVKGEDKKYYLGLSTAYDTVRGWVFQMIGEEGVETFKEALRAEAYNRLVKPKKEKAVPMGDVIPWSVKRQIMESEENCTRTINHSAVYRKSDFCSYAEPAVPEFDDHDVSGLLEE